MPDWVWLLWKVLTYLWLWRLLVDFIQAFCAFSDALRQLTKQFDCFAWLQSVARIVLVLVRASDSNFIKGKDHLSNFEVAFDFEGHFQIADFLQIRVGLSHQPLKPLLLFVFQLFNLLISLFNSIISLHQLFKWRDRHCVHLHRTRVVFRRFFLNHLVFFFCCLLHLLLIQFCVTVLVDLRYLLPVLFYRGLSLLGSKVFQLLTNLIEQDPLEKIVFMGGGRIQFYWFCVHSTFNFVRGFGCGLLVCLRSRLC